MRKLAIVAGVVLVLLIVAYFVATSSAFVRGVILPRVGKAMNAQVTASDVSISPFSSVVLRQLNVQTAGAGPLLQVEEVRLRYQLWSILRGDIRVDEVLLSSPVVNLTLNPDGTSNADALLKSGPPSKKPAPASGQPPRIDLRNFALKNGAVRVARNLSGGARETAELSNINITLDHLANAASGTLNLDAAFKLDCQTNGALQAKAAGKFTFALDAGLRPQSAKGSARLDVGSATGPLADLAQLAGVLDCELTPTELKQLVLHFEKGGRQLGIARIEGPLDATKGEGNLKFEISSIDRSVLNLAGAPMGFDFGGTVINSTGRVGITNNNSQFNADGQVNVSGFSVAQSGRSTPAIDLSLACQIAVNAPGETARIGVFTVTGDRSRQRFLSGSLRQPITITWGKSSGVAGDSAFELGVTNFNLGDWKPFLSDSIAGGRLQAAMNLAALQGGKQMKLDANAEIDDLAMNLGETKFSQGRLVAHLQGQIEDLKRINIAEYKLNLSRGQKPALNLTGSANYDGSAFMVRCGTELAPLSLMGRGPDTTLSADLRAEGALDKQVFTLKELLVSLAPTKLAPKNELHAAGKLDVSNPKISRGSASVMSDTLDLTPLYDTFAGSKKPESATSTTSAPAAASSPQLEPEAMNLPYELTVDATINKLFLREMVVSGFAATMKIADNHIVLDPFKCAFNNAPLNARADIDLGVKGYKYELGFTADSLPLEPIANSFSPGNRGQYQGAILGNARIRGAGITGVSL
ncbi:MAG TPA: hypothetical protein VLU94_02855, partial [Candidatus Nitrosotalea sp.]|nr:hypothetical protein [Candidatus Nitrosotalea sp.]